MHQRLLAKRPARTIVLLSLFILVYTLNSCSAFSQEPPPSEEPAPLPTETATEPPTATFTELPSLTPTETVTSTELPSLTSTETPTATATLTETPSATFTPSATATPNFEITEEAETTIEPQFEETLSNPPLLLLDSAETCTETITFDDPFENELFDVEIITGNITTGTGVDGTKGVYGNQNTYGLLGAPQYGSALVVRVSVPAGTVVVGWSASVAVAAGGGQASYARYQVAGVASNDNPIGTPTTYPTFATYEQVLSVALSSVEWLEIQVNQNTSEATGAVYLDDFTVTYLCGSPTPTPTPSQTPTPGGPTTVYITFDDPVPAGFSVQVITGEVMDWIGQDGTRGVFAHQNELGLLGQPVYGNSLQVLVTIPDGITVVGWSAYASQNPYSTGGGLVYERHEVNGEASGYAPLGEPGIYGTYTLHGQTATIETDWVEFVVNQNTSAATGGVYLDTIAIQYTDTPTLTLEGINTSRS